MASSLAARNGDRVQSQGRWFGFGFRSEFRMVRGSGWMEGFGLHVSCRKGLLPLRIRLPLIITFTHNQLGWFGIGYILLIKTSQVKQLTRHDNVQLKTLQTFPNER